MKKLISISLIVFSILIACTSAEIKDTTTIIDLTGQSKKQIFEKSLQWISYKFVSGRAVTDYKNFEVGRIIGKGSVIKFGSIGMRIEMEFVATIDCLANKARIIVERTNCSALAPNGNKWPCTSSYLWPKDLKGIETMAQDFANEYKTYMQGGRGAAWDGR